jgi:hypothetical protein
LIAPLEHALRGRVPGTFSLRINVGAATSARIDYKIAQGQIAAWVLDVAGTVSVGETTRFESASLPFEVQLYCRNIQGSKVLVSRWSNGDVESLRLVRVMRALVEKCPKLKTAAAGGRVSILVLESNDVAFGNVVAIAAAVRNALAQRADPPEQIFLVETEEHPWVVWVLKEGADIYPDIQNIPESGPHYMEGQMSE